MPNPHDAARSGPPPGWPRPPFDWPSHEPVEPAGVWACGLDTVEGRSLQAFAREVDPRVPEWSVGPKAHGPFVALSLARVARITLSAPLEAADSPDRPGLAQIPVARLERDYSVHASDGRELLRGRTVGYVETDAGHFLFSAQPGHIALKRMLVPRAANLTCRFGPSASDPNQWITDPDALRTALASLRGRRIPRMGEALVQLGLLTPQVIEGVLAQPSGRGRLGERLVQQGLITPEQLEVGLALKLGFPLVDLAHFPVDPSCVSRMSPELVKRHGAVPIWREGRQLVVAMDRPATAATLEASNLWPGLTIAPVFAPRGAILLTLATHRGDDAWSQEAPWR